MAETTDAGTAGPQERALTHAAAPRAGAAQGQMVAVARSAGVSPLRQFAQMLGLRGGQSRINPGEYYDYQLYRPTLSPAERREFVGERGSLALNLALAPPNVTQMRGFLGDKLALTLLMQALGLPTTRIQAAFAPHRGFGQLRSLRDAAEIAEFLRHEARFPLFGKPIKGAQAMGSVRIEGLEGETAHLGSGKSVGLRDLAAEIARSAEGYVFQDVVPVAPEIVALTGSQTVSTLRVVTVMRGEAPEVLYAAWKLPGPGAVSDNFWQGGSLIAAVDPQSLKVEKLRLGTGLATQWPSHHPEGGAALQGITLPHGRAALDLALAAHAVVPDNGLLGWDIALVPGGACLIECNENTGHALYQLSHDRGVLNDQFRPVFAAIRARNAELLARHARQRRAYEAAKARF